MTQETKPIRPVFRFAPSPNGMLHLGHAYSALLNLRMARSAGGRMLLRIEDIDRVRCTPKLVSMMLSDLEWLGFEWDEEPRRQSEHFDVYARALTELEHRGLAYPSFLSRTQIRGIAAERPGWPVDPDGAPIYPGTERSMPAAEREAEIIKNPDHALRIDVASALKSAHPSLNWLETGSGPAGETGIVEARPQVWGDAILGRRDFPASYHLACVIDDSIQEISHVVRGLDLFHATSMHRLLQDLLNLKAPTYHHHVLIKDPTGRKLSKSRGDTALRHLRDAGSSARDIRAHLGFDW
jgi:glutamyl-Q tRNA(Asp) synthetase